VREFAAVAERHTPRKIAIIANAFPRYPLPFIFPPEILS
jgi:hypothetical protein